MFNGKKEHRIGFSARPESGSIQRKNQVFGDEDPRRRITERQFPTKREDGYKPILRKQRLFISSLQKGSSDVHEDFTTTIQKAPIRNIRAFRFIEVSVDYTAGVTPIRCGFIRFPDFEGNVSSEGTEYHAHFPVTYTASSQVRFSYTFPTSYIQDFKTLQVLPSRLRVQFYKEDTSGNIVLFEEVNSASVEIELVTSQSDGLTYEHEIHFIA
jgi:hypothetical protein